MSIDEVMRVANDFGFSPLLRHVIEQHVAEAVAKEREECAKVCDALNFVDTGTSPIGTRASNRHCAAAIRARAEKDVP